MFHMVDRSFDGGSAIIIYPCLSKIWPSTFLSTRIFKINIISYYIFKVSNSVTPT